MISSFSHDVPTRNTESSLLRRHGGGGGGGEERVLEGRGGAPQRPPSALRTGSWSREVAGWTLGSMRGLCRSERENTEAQKHRLPGRRHAANRRAEPRRRAVGWAGQIESWVTLLFFLSSSSSSCSSSAFSDAGVCEERSLMPGRLFSCAFLASAEGDKRAPL